jgi:zinc protease
METLAGDWYVAEVRRSGLGWFACALAPMLVGGAAGQALGLGPVEFSQETLDNGLRVIYAPLHQAPVVHVRVGYHVGSRDERPDRQGFAHMFEHMMFRGSEHVKPEEHMKLIGVVGGYSNAFTSFDKTVYHDTLPASQLELALYLEADRMASFKVSDEIYQTERKVVTEEWRMYENRPYGHVEEDFLATLFTKHPYRWTPIGDMNNLRAAQAAELQEFFNKYYVPNNAVLIIAGDFDLAEAKALVKKYYAWIPRGGDVKRDIPAEPAQTEPRRLEIKSRVPAAKIIIGYPTPPHASDDNFALDLLAKVLSGGKSSRLERTLVLGTKPMCVSASAELMDLEDAGVFSVDATVLAGRDAAEVEKTLSQAVADVLEHGVTAEELQKAKTQMSLQLIRDRQTADKIASQLDSEYLLTGDPARVNTTLAKYQAVKIDDIKAVARKYLEAKRSTTVRVTPDPAAPLVSENLAAPVASTKPIAARAVRFPEGYPAKPPVSSKPLEPHFQKGAETTVGGVRVIVIPDARLPLVNWTLAMRRGSDSDPAEKVGLAGMTAKLVRAGSTGLPFAELNQDLDSRAISIEIQAEGDVTRLSGSCTTDQLDHAMDVSRKVLREPTFPADEFARRLEQQVNSLRLRDENPTPVAEMDLASALFDDTPLGRRETPASVGRLTLDDVKAFYRAAYRPNDAVLVISGDVTVEQGQTLAKKLLADWEPAAMPAPDYTLPKAPEKRTLIVVDRPDAKQSALRMGVRAYDLHSDDKYPGDLAGRILTAGIDSRLGRYVRAEKGLAYGVWGLFRAGRHGGSFTGGTDTTIPSTADAVEAMIKVFDDLRAADVTDAELADAKLRVVGMLVLGMQTIAEQARYRLDGVLADYPVDYYDKYPARVGQVTKQQVREVMDKYVRTDRLVIVVVAPAEKVKEQLSRLGEVKVVPMPARRAAAAPVEKTPPAAQP